MPSSTASRQQGVDPRAKGVRAIEREREPSAAATIGVELKEKSIPPSASLEQTLSSYPVQLRRRDGAEHRQVRLGLQLAQRVFLGGGHGDVVVDVDVFVCFSSSLLFFFFFSLSSRVCQRQHASEVPAQSACE